MSQTLRLAFVLVAVLRALPAHPDEAAITDGRDSDPSCEYLLAPDSQRDYVVLDSGRAPIKAWIRGVPMDYESREQIKSIARLPFIFSHIAIMPDVHYGKGATVGSIIPTVGAVIPSAVGVDIGCGMMAVQTTLEASDLPRDLAKLRSQIEATVPVGGVGAAGGWGQFVPNQVSTRFRTSGLESRMAKVLEKNPGLKSPYNRSHLGTLGGGNHFLELAIDESGHVWILLHTGSRGPGNAIGTYFIRVAQKMLARRPLANQFPNPNLAWLEQGEPEFEDYLEAAGWAQDYARLNREIIMDRTLMVLRKNLKKFQLTKMKINSHHNYLELENHFGTDVFITRKGAVRARQGELGIIPGSMGARSYIVRGRGNPEAFDSCSHGAGRAVSRSDARELFTLDDHVRATEGVECRKDAAILDETPGAYKNIDAVMEAQKSLVEPLHRLKQVLSVKGI